METGADSVSDPAKPASIGSSNIIEKGVRLEGSPHVLADAREMSLRAWRVQWVVRQYGALTTTYCEPCGWYQVLPHCW